MDNLTLKTYLKEKLKNPEFKKEWGRSETQYQITRQFILARLEKNFSQRKLAQKAKTT